MHRQDLELVSFGVLTRRATSGLVAAQPSVFGSVGMLCTVAAFRVARCLTQTVELIPSGAVRPADAQLAFSRVLLPVLAEHIFLETSVPSKPSAR